MSDYVRNKAVRYLPTAANLAELGITDIEDLADIEDREEFKGLFGRRANPFFDTVNTIGEGWVSHWYIDYVLRYDYGDECGEFGKIRRLYDSELDKYTEKFKAIFKNSEIVRENFRLVDYCWYNCSEPPDYFDETKDEFYDEV